MNRASFVRLGDVAQEVSVKATAGHVLPVYSVTKHVGFVPSLEFFKKQVFSRDTARYKLVRRDQFAYATIHLDEGSLGLLTSAEAVLISPMYTVFEVDTARVYPPYLYRALKSPKMMSAYSRLGKGSVHRRKAISFERLADLSINLPSFPEQRRIAEILDRADAIRRKRREAIVLTEELLRSAFLEQFGDPVNNPNGWPVRLLGRLGELDRGRSRHRPRNDPSLLGGLHPLIQTGEVASCDGVIYSYKQTYSDLGLAQSKMWPAGTLCITIAANIAKTGVLAFDACFPDSVVGFTPGSEVTTEYIQYWISFLQPILERQAPQVAQKNINLEILRSLSAPTPPIDLQRAFSRYVTQIRRTRAKMHSSLESADALFGSLTGLCF